MTPSPPLISRASSATTLTLDLRDAPPPALRTVLDVDPVALPPTPGSLLLPNVMIVGVSHAGATDLARALARHPQVKLPVVQRIDHYSPLRFGRHSRVGGNDCLQVDLNGGALPDRTGGT